MGQVKVAAAKHHGLGGFVGGCGAGENVLAKMLSVSVGSDGAFDIGTFCQNLSELDVCRAEFFDYYSDAFGCGVSVRFEPADYDRVRQVSGFRKMSAFDGFFYFDPKLRRYFRM